MMRRERRRKRMESVDEVGVSDWFSVFANW